MKFNSLRSTDRKEYLEQLIKSSTLSSYNDRREFPIPRSNEKKIDEGLLSVGEVELRQRIKNCFNGPDFPNTKWNSKYGICGNIYCKGCRNLVANLHYHKVKKHIERSCINIKYVMKDEPLLFEEFERIFDVRPYTNNDFIHITGYVGLSTTRIEDLKKIIQEDTNRWKKIRRNLNKIKDHLYWIETAYEYELVNWKYLKDAPESDYKKKQIKQLIESTDGRFFNEPFVFVHFHGITNIPKENLHTVFKDVYHIKGKPLIKTHSETGLYVQRLHKDKDLEENIRKITSYPFKTAFRYKHSFIGSDYKNGEFFTPEELGSIIKIYNHMTGRGYRSLFRSASNNVDVWVEIHKKLDSLLKSTRDNWKRRGRSHRDIKLLTSMISVMRDIESNEGNCSKTKIDTMIDMIGEKLCGEDYKKYIKKSWKQIGSPKGLKRERIEFIEFWLHRKRSLPKLTSSVGEPFPFKSKNTNYKRSTKRILS